AVGEVLERPPLHLLRVPVNPLSAVVPGGEELLALLVGLGDELQPRHPRAAAADRIGLTVAEAHVRGAHAQRTRGDLGEPADDLLTGILDRTTIEIGTG